MCQPQGMPPLCYKGIYIHTYIHTARWLVESPALCCVPWQVLAYVKSQQSKTERERQSELEKAREEERQRNEEERKKKEALKREKERMRRLKREELEQNREKEMARQDAILKGMAGLDQV